MSTILIILLVLAMIAVVVALIRGLGAFLKSQEQGAGNEPAGEDMYAKQNRMMQARVFFQAVAIIIVVLIGIAAASN